jgi:hypothetical protein
MSATALHAGLKAAYEDVAYVGRPNHHSHPDRLAAIATLFGMTPADPARARVLEVGCGDAANLLPMAARYPDARFVACDYSALLMNRARVPRRRAGPGQRRVRRRRPARDRVLARHVRLRDRARLLFVGAGRRARRVRRDARPPARPGGLAFISYNVLPGCFVRRSRMGRAQDQRAAQASRARAAGATRGGASATSRTRGRRWTAYPRSSGREYATRADRSDSMLYHDDLSA